MIYSGMTSVTFRGMSPADVINICVKAGLEGIEWGGDIHVPVSQFKTAEEVRKMTVEGGMKVASYGSYYRVGQKNIQGSEFERVLETALYLGAPSIRVWAGSMASDKANEDDRQMVASDAFKIAELAEKAGVKINFELHGGTLMDTTASAVELLSRVEHKNLGTYWQMYHGLKHEELLDVIGELLPWMSNIHVFFWEVHQQNGIIRLPLLDGYAPWLEYLRLISSKEGERYALLEFIRGDDVKQFLEDAATLKKLLAQV